MSYEDFEWLMNINFWGVVHGTKAFLPHLKAAGEGHIVNLSSVFGLISVPSQSAYNAAKFLVQVSPIHCADSRSTSHRVVGVSGDRAPPAASRPRHRLEHAARPKRRELAALRRCRGTSTKSPAPRPAKPPACILVAVEKDKRRALIGPDAKAIDLISRLPAGLYQRVLARSEAPPVTRTAGPWDDRR